MVNVMSRKILFAEDNKSIADVFINYANKDGYKVDYFDNGKDALDNFFDNSYDMVVLDIMMPIMDGITVAKKIRLESDVPIIFLTAKGEEYDKIMGLDSGADDYIVKPFSPAEVMARIRALFRRMPKEQNSELIEIDDLILDLNSYTAKINSIDIKLSKREFEILWTLSSTPEKVFTRDNLLDSLWGFDYEGDLRTVDTHIKRLRAKIPESENRTWAIVTLRGLGYKFSINNQIKNK